MNPKSGGGMEQRAQLVADPGADSRLVSRQSLQRQMKANALFIADIESGQCWADSQGGLANYSASDLGLDVKERKLDVNSPEYIALRQRNKEIQDLLA